MVFTQIVLPFYFDSGYCLLGFGQIQIATTSYLFLPGLLALVYVPMRLNLMSDQLDGHQVHNLEYRRDNQQDEEVLAKMCVSLPHCHQGQDLSVWSRSFQLTDFGRAPRRHKESSLWRCPKSQSLLHCSQSLSSPICPAVQSCITRRGRPSGAGHHQSCGLISAINSQCDLEKESIPSRNCPQSLWVSSAPGASNRGFRSRHP